MAAWRYEISPLVLKKYFNCLISARPRNILYVPTHRRSATPPGSRSKPAIVSKARASTDYNLLTQLDVCSNFFFRLVETTLQQDYKKGILVNSITTMLSCSAGAFFNTVIMIHL